MLKDYYNPNLSPEHHSRISEFLSCFPSWIVFPTYGKARAFRLFHDYKDENGRFHLSIVKYDGFYYLLTKLQLHNFKLLLRSCSK